VLGLINVSGDEVDISVDAGEIGLAAGVLTDLVAGRSVDASDGRIELRLDPYDVIWLKDVVA
jgi:hypothetical protein